MRDDEGSKQLLTRQTFIEKLARTAPIRPQTSQLFCKLQTQHREQANWKRVKMFIIKL